MNEDKLIYDWNIINWELNRDESKHPHSVWFDDETLRDGLQSPSARNPTIKQKIELLTYMEKLGIQKVDLGFRGIRNGFRGIQKCIFIESKKSIWISRNPFGFLGF